MQKCASFHFARAGVLDLGFWVPAFYSTDSACHEESLCAQGICAS